MNAHVIVLAIGVVFGIICSSSSQETTTQISVEDFVNGIRNSFNNLSNLFNASDVQENFNRTMETVKPIIEKIQNEFNTTEIVSQVKSTLDTIIKAFNSSIPASSN